jgi:penicillin-binding protein 1A
MIENGSYGYYPRESYRTYLRAHDAAVQSDASPYLQGMVVVLEVSTGRILALVGGRDFKTSEFNRATQAVRQAGSAFKPFVFSAAVRQGNPLSRVIDDEPITIPSTKIGEPDWTPHNSDYEFQGPITLREALYRSRNAATVRLGMDIGISSVLQEARKFGITTPLPRYPSIVLGSADVLPLELVSAYSAFANRGQRATPSAIIRVEDRNGVVIWKPTVQQSTVMDRAQAWLMTNALRDVVRRGTAYSAITGAGFPYPSAGKTGTSDDYADNWYIGFTTDVVTGVWIGMDRRQPIMTGAQAGKLAAPVWTTVMREVYQHRPAPEPWLQPPGISAAEIDRSTGYRFTPFCPEETRAIEYFLLGTEPRGYCPIHRAPAPFFRETVFQP